MGQGLRLPYGRRITILTLRVLIVIRKPCFRRSMVNENTHSPPAGTVPVHVEREVSVHRTPRLTAFQIHFDHLELNLTLHAMAWRSSRPVHPRNIDVITAEIVLSTFPDDIP